MPDLTLSDCHRVPEHRTTSAGSLLPQRFPSVMLIMRGFCPCVSGYSRMSAGKYASKTSKHLMELFCMARWNGDKPEKSGILHSSSESKNKNNVVS